MHVKLLSILEEIKISCMCTSLTVEIKLPVLKYPNKNAILMCNVDGKEGLGKRLHDYCSRKKLT